MSGFEPRTRSQLGLVGAGTMGSNLALRIDALGCRLQVYERDPRLRDAARAALPQAIGCHAALAALLAALETPRCLLLLVTAGKAVDAVLEDLLPALAPGDVVVDLGNSHYQDTRRRVAAAAARGVLFVGCGISGGAEGARTGAALMPGGNADAWPLIGDLLRDIAADFEGEPCAHWVGPDGAGHFVKTVHNGIEYAEMQLLAETYHLMRERLELDCAAIGGHFAAWNEGPLQSYLLEISARILGLADRGGTPAVDLILDRAGQKGTGSWTSEAALRYGAPANLLAEAVFARVVSAFKARREKLAARFTAPAAPAARITVDDLEAALFAARTIAYAQGFELMHAASGEYDWGLDYAAIAAGWRAGCILRSRALADLRRAFGGGYGDGLLADEAIGSQLAGRMDALRRVAGFGIASGIPVAGFAAAVNWYDAMHCRVLPANLIQAQRDFFGAHGFQAAAAPDEAAKHIDWSAAHAELR